MIYIGYNKEIGGIGDFCYILFQFYFFYSNVLYYKPELKIYIPEHSLKYCIECITTEPANINIINIISKTNISNIFITNIYNIKDTEKEKDILIYSNMNDFLHILIRYCNKTKLSVLKKEFRENIFHITPFIREYTENIKQKSGITGKYMAIHIRCGDKYLLNNINNKDVRCSPDNILEQKFILGLEFLKKINSNIPICIFCDNHSYKKYLAEKYNCFYFLTEIIHTSIENIDNNSCFDTFSEFVLLSEASIIFALTISNFSRVPSFIFDVQIYSFISGDNLNIIKYNEI